ncbi:MAG: hypothetical protein IKV55_03320 [Oscillospiraceae bacterium]|nr:hypothetical protein [Oscillospiraceae bacterium]
MVFYGITKTFSLAGEQQYHTIGSFWDEMAALHGLENLQGLGYLWKDGEIYYAIGLKEGRIAGCNFCLQLPDDGWTAAAGETDRLQALYNEIYKDGPLRYEIETFYEDGRCEVRYRR